MTPDQRLLLHRYHAEAVKRSKKDNCDAQASAALAAVEDVLDILRIVYVSGFD